MQKLHVLLLVTLAVLLSTLTVNAAVPDFDLTYLSSFGPSDRQYNRDNAVSVAYDFISRRMFVANAGQNRIDVFDISNPSAPKELTPITSEVFSGLVVGRVAVHTGVLAVSLSTSDIVSRGKVFFINTESYEVLGIASVRSYPNHLVFTRTGRRLLVANEGRPNADYSVDPLGEISIVKIGDGVEFNRVNLKLISNTVVVKNLNFTSYSKLKSFAGSEYARFRTNNGIEQDIEPTFITISPDNALPRAYVSCQLNNVIAEIDLDKESIIKAWGLKFRDFSKENYGFDPSDADGLIAVNTTWPVKGVPGPNGIASYYRFTDKDHVKDDVPAHYVVVANQGKARVVGSYDERRVVSNIILDPKKFTDAAELQTKSQLGNLVVSVNGGDTNNDGRFDQLYAFGSRSISIWDVDSYSQVWESGNQIEQYIAKYDSQNFNSEAIDNFSFDHSSPFSGPEPVAVAYAKIDYRSIIFVALRQQGGIMMFDVTNAKKPRFITYSTHRNFNADPSDLNNIGDLQPEEIFFLPAHLNGAGVNLVGIVNSASASVSLFEVFRKNPSFSAAV